jgi:hypothetical protein
MERCYLPVKHESKLPKFLQQVVEAVDDKAWVPYFNFMALPLEKELTDTDPFLRKLNEIRSFRSGILRVEPDTVYNWHVDSERKSSLNMLLYDDGNSRCIFAPYGFGIVMPVVELKYRPNTFYAFNTQIVHMVCNTSEPRYLFSIEFTGDDKDLSYEQLCKDIQGLNYGY